MQRFLTRPDGSYDILVAPRTHGSFHLWDSVTGFVKHGRYYSGDSGSSFDFFEQLSETWRGFRNECETVDCELEQFLGSALWDIPRTPDSDGDGLSSEVEFIVGTDDELVDTDQDGLSDQAEVEQGLNPLDGLGFTVTGLIANLPLPGEAKEVVLEGSVLDGRQQFAYIATGDAGLSIVDASQFDLPIVLGQIDLPGDSTDVAIDSNLQIAAVVSNEGGLHFVDVSDPMMPTLTRTVNVSATNVEVVDGVGYVTVGGSIWAIDLVSGEIIQSLSISSNITDITREGLMLYTMSVDRTLRAIDISGFNMSARGSLQLPDGGGQLFVGNGVAYAAANSNGRGGFSTANVSDPDNIVLVSGSDVPDGFIAPSDVVVTNGSGVGLLAGQPLFGANRLEVMDVRRPEETNGFITRFELPGEVRDIAIGSGIAFVAAGSSGVQVVNYLPFDNQGRAPTVVISTPGADIDSGTPGFQVEFGSSVQVVATIDDDVQVRNAELLVNGNVVANDVSFPFDFTATAFPLTGDATTAVVQVRATDTGGNSSLSNEITLNLTPDVVAPTVTAVSPRDGDRILRTDRTVRVGFSESVAQQTVTASTFRLLDSLGEDVSPPEIQLRSNDRVVNLSYASLEPGEYQLILEEASITDRAGNPLGEQILATTFTVTEATAAWYSELDGLWSDAVNWRGGVLPGPEDIVLIDVAAQPTITHNQGDTVIAGLISYEDLVVSGGDFTINGVAKVDGPLRFSGTTLRNAVLEDMGGDNRVSITGDVTFDGVTIDGVVELPTIPGLGGATLHVQNGLTVNGTLILVDNKRVVFKETATGQQMLLGTGVVTFGQSGFPIQVPSEVNVEGDTTLTIGPDIKITGAVAQGVVIGPSFEIDGVSTVINQGLISSNAPIGHRSARLITIAPDVFVNEGTIEAIEGGTLRVNATWTNSNTVRVDNDGHVSIDGALTNTGTFEKAGDGRISVSGVVENEGRTLAVIGDSTQVGMTLDNVEVRGGSVGQPDTTRSQLTGEVTFDGVTIDGVVELPTIPGLGGATLHVQNGLTVNGTLLLVDNKRVVFKETSTGQQMLLGTGTVTFGQSGFPIQVPSELNVEGDTTLTIGPDIKITGAVAQGVIIGPSFEVEGVSTVINQGLISSNVPIGHRSARRITIAPDAFVNEGTVEAIEGGLVVFNVSVDNSGVFHAGSNNRIELNGDYDQLASGLLLIDVAGLGVQNTGVLAVSGQGDLAGTLRVAFVDGFLPSTGNSFNVMTYGTHINQFSEINGGTVTFTPDYLADGIVLRAIAAANDAVAQALAQLADEEIRDAIDEPPMRGKASIDDDARKPVETNRQMIVDLVYARNIGFRRPDKWDAELGDGDIEGVEECFCPYFEMADNMQ